MKSDVVWINRDDVIAETGKAIMVENARGEAVWLPKSQIEQYQDGTISVPQWLADDKEIDGSKRK